VKISLSLFIFLATISTFFFHIKSEEKSQEALTALLSGIFSFSVIFLTLKRLLTLGSQKRFMLGFSGLIAWMGAIVGIELFYLNSNNVHVYYFYSLIASIVYLMIFLVAYLYQLLNRISKL
jgi:hypothetical protein